MFIKNFLDKPIFIVSNNSNNVVEVNSFLAAIIEKFELAPVLDLLDFIFSLIFDWAKNYVKDYQTFVWFNDLYNRFVDLISSFYSKSFVSTNMVKL